MPTAAEEGRPGGLRARQREQARARLLQSAKEVFSEKGYMDVRIADIAARAGVSHGLFYHYFESKQDIFRALAAAVDQELFAMDVVLDSSSAATPRERLSGALRLHFETYREEARMMAVIEEVSRYDETVRAARDALHATENHRLTEAVRQLQRRGLADQRLDPVVAALAIGSMTWRFAERWLIRHDLDADFDHVVDQFVMVLMNTLQVQVDLH
jgi:AcrR family transcriptional regulator